MTGHRSTQYDNRLQSHNRRWLAAVLTMTNYSSTRGNCDTVLTVDMVDIVGAYLRVVCLLPAQGQFVSDAVRKRLWFRKPATNKQYLQNDFSTTVSSTGTSGNLRFTSIRTTQKKNTGSSHKLTNVWPGQEFLRYRKKILQSTKLTFCVMLNTFLF
jgi:hypothetical protein